MASLKKLCEILIETDGNPSVQQVLECGCTMEHFIRFCQIGRETLVSRAKEALKRMEE